MENTLEFIKKHFVEEKVLYTWHAKNEMKFEEFGTVYENEVFESIMNGEMIERYEDDKPYPSYLIYGFTKSKRPLHIVCAVNVDDDIIIVITVYHPNPQRWIDYRKRR